MKRTTNPFKLLEEVVDDKTTSDLFRKAKKKLREIENLKKKENLTEEENEKIQMEDVWTSIVKPKPKPIPSNKFKIQHSLCSKNNRKKTREQEKEGYECPICFDPVPKEDIVETNCNHLFCKGCITSIINHSRNYSIHCSLCRTQIKNFDFQTEENRHEIMNLLSFNSQRMQCPYQRVPLPEPISMIEFLQRSQLSYTPIREFYNDITVS